MLKGSQASETTTPLYPISFSVRHGYLHTCMHQPSHRHIHTFLKNKLKVKFVKEHCDTCSITDIYFLKRVHVCEYVFVCLLWCYIHLCVCICVCRCICPCVNKERSKIQYLLMSYPNSLPNGIFH